MDLQFSNQAALTLKFSSHPNRSLHLVRTVPVRPPTSATSARLSGTVFRNCVIPCDVAWQCHMSWPPTCFQLHAFCPTATSVGHRIDGFPSDPCLHCSWKLFSAGAIFYIFFSLCLCISVQILTKPSWLYFLHNWGCPCRSSRVETHPL